MLKPVFPQRVFVTGIGTGVGKTVVSAVLAEALQADYWKPVQTGTTEGTDSDTVRQWLANQASRVYPEAYRFAHPSSPHYAAMLEQQQIALEAIRLPATTNRLVIEGAGGLLVPLNRQQLMIDLIAHLRVPVVVVVRQYLGSINHTLLSIEALQQRHIPVAGLIMNGESFLDNEAIVAHFSGIRVLGHVREAATLSRTFVRQQAEAIQQTLLQFYRL